MFIKLLEFATVGCFSYDRIFCQRDGCSMGSLATTLANVFMGTLERKWQEKVFSPTFYRPYIDDLVCVFEHEEDVDRFHDFLNKQHANLKFTVEKGGKSIAFLDVNVSLNNVLSTEVYRRLTCTGQLLHQMEVCPG